MIIFIIGFLIMFFNEGFVIMRHVSPWFADKRKLLHEKYGVQKVRSYWRSGGYAGRSDGARYPRCRQKVVVGAGCGSVGTGAEG